MVIQTTKFTHPRVTCWAAIGQRWREWRQVHNQNRPFSAGALFGSYHPQKTTITGSPSSWPTEIRFSDAASLHAALETLQPEARFQREHRLCNHVHRERSLNAETEWNRKKTHRMAASLFKPNNDHHGLPGLEHRRSLHMVNFTSFNQGNRNLV